MHNPQKILAQSEIIHTKHEIEAAITRLATKINQVLFNQRPVIISVMSGGMVFAGQLLTQITLEAELDYLHVSRYQNDTSGKKLTWYALPQTDLSGRTVLLLDDILDEGITLQAVYDKCMALGASKVFSAVLVEKELNQNKVFSADFVGLKVPNRYVYGYGMDIHGWWRNLPAIYVFVE